MKSLNLDSLGQLKLIVTVATGNFCLLLTLDTEKQTKFYFL